MKFSEIGEEQWPELKPYLDSCLLPLTGLSGEEAPWQATLALERLRDVMDLVEIPFKGRVVTYPAAHYNADDESFAAGVERICRKLRASGFRYIIVISADASIAAMHLQGPDLALFPVISDGQADAEKQRVRGLIQALWQQGDQKNL